MSSFNGRHYRGYMRAERQRKRLEAFNRRIQETKADTDHSFRVDDTDESYIVLCGTEQCQEVWDIRHRHRHFPPKSPCPMQPVEAKVKAESNKKRIEKVATAADRQLSELDRRIASSLNRKTRKR